MSYFTHNVVDVFVVDVFVVDVVQAWSALIDIATRVASMPTYILRQSGL